MMTAPEIAAISSHRRTVGSRAGALSALIARSVSSLPRWAPLMLAVLLAACDKGGGGSGY
jgi:hypothetical protein